MPHACEQDIRVCCCALHAAVVRAGWMGRMSRCMRGLMIPWSQKTFFTRFRHPVQLRTAIVWEGLETHRVTQSATCNSLTSWRIKEKSPCRHCGVELMISIQDSWKRLFYTHITYTTNMILTISFIRKTCICHPRTLDHWERLDASVEWWMHVWEARSIVVDPTAGWMRAYKTFQSKVQLPSTLSHARSSSILGTTLRFATKTREQSIWMVSNQLRRLWDLVQR